MESNVNSNSTRIDASPTKDFFIHMLVKDIDLTQAISDLVDNSIDGAKKVRGNSAYEGLKIEIQVNKDFFSISDNCGGIDVEIARRYAFRFGRVSEAGFVDYSVGRFGVGMKRAIFKLGNYFSVASKTQNSKFTIEQDIQDWASRTDDWSFSFSELEENCDFPIEETGTTIKVANLHEGIEQEFGLENYRTRLINDLAEDHQISLNKGLSITVNDISLVNPQIYLLSSQHIRPAYKNTVMSRGELTVRLFTGVIKTTESEKRLDPEKAGWSIFCNERLILKNDKSTSTGWGSENSNPSFHNDFARFRGFTFFESSNPELLPWNTTKSGIDLEHPSYRRVRQEMANSMKPVIKFLRKLAREIKNNDVKDEPTPLEQLLREAQPANIEDILAISEGNFFYDPEEAAKLDKKEKWRTIQYQKSESDIEKVKETLGVETLSEIGSITFDYFVKMECED